MTEEQRPEQTPPFDPFGGPNPGGGSRIYGDVRGNLAVHTDNFDRLVANPLVDLIDVAGEKDFTPERQRFFKDGSRVFLQYGTDATFSETNQGYLLQPGGGQTLTLRTAEKSAYQVGFDLWPTQSFQINGTLQSGDAVGGGYGRLDIGNFDPAQVDTSADNPASGTYTGTTADGYLWYHTSDTGLNQRLLALAQAGTVLDSRIVDLRTSGDIFQINEIRLNCYAVGPAVFRQTTTDVANRPKDPQINDTYGAVANDDGQGSSDFSHRAVFGIKQGSGNSGLELEAGSMAIRAPGNQNIQYKTKGHSMDLELTDSTSETYQVLAAMRIDTARENVKLRFTDLTIINTPGNSVQRARVLIMAVDPANTNAEDKTFVVPPEHSEANSVLREVEVAGDATTPLTGPIEDDANTDSTGAATANTFKDPGGYQLIRSSLTPEGGGAKTAVDVSTKGEREVVPGDIALVLVDGETTGTYEIDVATEQNS